MKKAIFLAVVVLAAVVPGRSQSIPDATRLAKMSPAELEAYKQQLLKQASSRARQLSTQYDLKIDETALPGFEARPPVKDLKRLGLIPGVVPSMAQVTGAVRATERQLQSLTPPAVVTEVKTMAAKQDAAELQGSAVGQWMNNNPVQALLLSMESATKSPGEITAWNNLAAFYNMTGMEHKAVPILK